MTSQRIYRNEEYVLRDKASGLYMGLYDKTTDDINEALVITGSLLDNSRIWEQRNLEAIKLNWND